MYFGKIKQLLETKEASYNSHNSGQSFTVFVIGLEYCRDYNHTRIICKWKIRIRDSGGHSGQDWQWLG